MVSLFLSKDEEFVLRNLEQTRPEGLHQNSIKPITVEALLERRFVVQSEAGFLYCTVNGLRYLQDQSSTPIRNDIYLPDPTFKERVSKFLNRIFSR